MFCKPASTYYQLILLEKSTYSYTGLIFNLFINNLLFIFYFLHTFYFRFEVLHKFLQSLFPFPLIYLLQPASNQQIQTNLVSVRSVQKCEWVFIRLLRGSLNDQFEISKLRIVFGLKWIVLVVEVLKVLKTQKYLQLIRFKELVSCYVERLQ